MMSDESPCIAIKLAISQRMAQPRPKKGTTAWPVIQMAGQERLRGVLGHLQSKPIQFTLILLLFY